MAKKITTTKPCEPIKKNNNEVLLYAAVIFGFAVIIYCFINRP